MVQKHLWIARLSAGVFCALAAVCANASESWIRINTPHFEVIGSIKATQARQLAQELENGYQALQPLSLRADGNTGLVRVVAFKSDKQFTTFSANSAASAYYLHTSSNSYIVLSAESLASATPALHEYAHHIVHRSYQHLPLWLDEGIADVYSTVRRNGDILQLGLPLPERLDWLREDGLAYPLDELFTLRPDSFASTRRMLPQARFYCESWALVHMLRLDPRFSPQFAPFLRLVDDGQSPAAALNSLYGVSVSELQSELSVYIRERQFPTELSRASGPSATVESAVTIHPIDENERRRVLAELRESLPATVSEPHAATFGKAGQ